MERNSLFILMARNITIAFVILFLFGNCTKNAREDKIDSSLIQLKTYRYILLQSN